MDSLHSVQRILVDSNHLSHNATSARKFEKSGARTVWKRFNLNLRIQLKDAKEINGMVYCRLMASAWSQVSRPSSEQTTLNALKRNQMELEIRIQRSAFRTEKFRMKTFRMEAFRTFRKPFEWKSFLTEAAASQKRRAGGKEIPFGLSEKLECKLLSVQSARPFVTQTFRIGRKNVTIFSIQICLRSKWCP